MFTQVRFFKEPNPGDVPPSMLDIINNPDTPQPTLEELAVAAQAELVLEATAEDGSLKPGYVKADDGTIIKDENYVAPIEGLKNDGTLEEGYIKDATGNVIKDPNYKPADEESQNEVEEFFNTLNSITGFAIDVEYPEGVDPLSPQGIALYSQTLVEQANLTFEEHLASTDPRGYAYLLHRKAGLPDEEFFGEQKGFILPDKATFEASADLHASVYKYELKAKGMDDDTIDVLIKDAIAKSTLKTKADAAYNYINKMQEEDLASIEKFNKENDIETDIAIKTMVAELDKSINSNIKFVIPEPDKANFKQFVINNMRYDTATKTFSLVQDIAPDKVNKIIESMFFQYKNGDLKALIEKQAKTQTAQGVRLRTNKTNIAPGGGKANDRNEPKHIPLGEIFNTQQ